MGIPPDILAKLAELAEEEGPVVEEKAATAEEVIVTEAQALEPKIEAAAEVVSTEAKALAQEAETEAKAILDKLEDAFGEQGVDQVESQCEAEAAQKALAQPAEPAGVPKPTVTDPKLQNLVKDLYKGAETKSPIGTGSTADAIRHEISTGEPVGGKWHTDKGVQYSRALTKWLEKNPSATPADRAAAQSMLDDLTKALKGK